MPRLVSSILLIDIFCHLLMRFRAAHRCQLFFDVHAAIMTRWRCRHSFRHQSFDDGVLFSMFTPRQLSLRRKSDVAVSALDLHAAAALLLFARHCFADGGLPRLFATPMLFTPCAQMPRWLMARYLFRYSALIDT